jgi:hypothetical protein
MIEKNVIARVNEFASVSQQRQQSRINHGNNNNNDNNNARADFDRLFEKIQRATVIGEDKHVDLSIKRCCSVDSELWYEQLIAIERLRAIALDKVLSNDDDEKNDSSSSSKNDIVASMTSKHVNELVISCFVFDGWKLETKPKLTATETLLSSNKSLSSSSIRLAISTLCLQERRFERAIFGLLEIVFYERTCLRNLREENMNDLLDFCVERLERVKVLSFLDTNDYDNNENDDDDDDDDGQNFAKAMSCLSIIRHVCDRISEIPLSAIANLVSKHKIHSHLLPSLLQRRPWCRMDSKKNKKIFNDGEWIEPNGHLPKPEAQVWLCLRALLAEPVCSGRHDYFDATFEQSLIELKDMLINNSSSRLIDQIPQLGGDGLQRAVLYHLHEMRVNKRDEVETNLFDKHVLTKNLNAMKGDSNKSSSSQQNDLFDSVHEERQEQQINERKDQLPTTMLNITNNNNNNRNRNTFEHSSNKKEFKFSFIQPILSKSFRESARINARDNATAWVNDFIAKCTEDFDKYAARVREQVLTMFDDSNYYDDNVINAAVKMNPPEKNTAKNDSSSSSYTVRVQFSKDVENDDDNDNNENNELMFTFNRNATNDQNQQRLSSDVTILKKDTNTLVRGERYQCVPLSDGHSRHRLRWFSNPRYVKVTLISPSSSLSLDKNNETSSSSSTFASINSSIKTTEISKALDSIDDDDDASQNNDNKKRNKGSFWMTIGSLSKHAFAVQIQLKCRHRSRSLLAAKEEEVEEEDFFAFDLSLKTLACTLSTSSET